MTDQNIRIEYTMRPAAGLSMVALEPIDAPAQQIQRGSGRGGFFKRHKVGPAGTAYIGNPPPPKRPFPRWLVNGVEYTICGKCGTLIRQTDGPHCGSCHPAIAARRKAKRKARKAARKIGAAAGGAVLAFPSAESGRGPTATF